MTNEEKAEGTPETTPNKVRRKGSRVKRSEDKESSKKSRDRKKSKDAVTQKERKKKREKGESTPKEKKRRGSRAQKPRKKDLEKVENEEKDTNSSTPEVSTPNEATPARSEENEAPADVQETTLDEPEAKQEETPEKKSEETAEVNQEESETKKEEPKEEPKEDSKEEQKALEAAKKEPEVPEVKEEPKDNNQLSKSKGSITKDKKKVTKTTTPPVQTNMKPIQPAQDDTPKEKRRFGFPFRKKKKEAVVGGIIAGSVKHEGHAGFESGGGLSTKGLPPHIAEIFEKLNKTFIDLGYDEITQNEVKFVLQKFGHILIPSNPTPPPPAPAPVSPEELSFEELLEQFKTQNATLQGLKATHTTIQTAKEKLKAEVEQLNEVLAQERKLLNEQQEKNTTLEVEAARLRSSGSAAGNDNTAFTDLEALMKTKLDEAAKKLAAEQEKTKELQKLLDQYADEKAALQKSLGEAEEIIKQNRTNLSSSKSTPTPSPSAPPANIPAPPPMNIPPPPVAPPLGDMGNKTNKPATGGGGGLNLNVTLKKTEPIEKPKSGPTTDDLLKQIRSGTALKKVEHDPSERKPASDADDSNVLNIIAKALLDRRNGITMDDEANPDDEWGDDDWE